MLASQVVIRYTSNSLERDDPDADDIRSIEMAFIPSEPLFVYGMRLSLKADIIGKIKVEDSDGRVVSTTMLEVPLNYDAKKGDAFADNIIICFHRPLVPGKQYLLKVTTSATQILYDLKNKDTNKTDYIEFAITGIASIEKLLFVAYIPEYMEVRLGDYSHPVAPRPAGFTWKAGSALPREDLARLDGLPSPNFKAIGWQTTGLAKGNVTGFAVTSI